MTNISVERKRNFTMFDNQLMEAIAKANLTLYETKTILALVRYSYGWNKEEALVSYSKISAFCGIQKCNISRAISGLLKKQIIIKTDKGYKIQDFTKWNVQFKSEIEADTNDLVYEAETNKANYTNTNITPNSEAKKVFFFDSPNNVPVEIKILCEWMIPDISKREAISKRAWEIAKQRGYFHRSMIEEAVKELGIETEIIDTLYKGITAPTTKNKEKLPLFQTTNSCSTETTNTTNSCSTETFNSCPTETNYSTINYSCSTETEQFPTETTNSCSTELKSFCREQETVKKSSKINELDDAKYIFNTDSINTFLNTYCIYKNNNSISNSLNVCISNKCILKNTDSCILKNTDSCFLNTNTMREFKIENFVGNTDSCFLNTNTERVESGNFVGNTNTSTNAGESESESEKEAKRRDRLISEIRKHFIYIDDDDFSDISIEKLEYFLFLLEKGKITADRVINPVYFMQSSKFTVKHPFPTLMERLAEKRKIEKLKLEEIKRRKEEFEKYHKEYGEEMKQKIKEFIEELEKKYPSDNNIEYLRTKAKAALKENSDSPFK